LSRYRTTTDKYSNIAVSVEMRDGLIENSTFSVQWIKRMFFSIPAINVWKLIKTGTAIKTTDSDFRLNNIFVAALPCFLYRFLITIIAISITGMMSSASSIPISIKR
jgi:hypothetical protein